MTEIHLTNNKGYEWLCKKMQTKTVWVKGFFVFDNKILRGEELSNFIAKFDLIDLPRILSKADGIFSVVIEYGNVVFAAVDHMRSFPLFYKKTEKGFCIFDTVSAEDWKNNSVDEKQEKLFLNTTYTLESNTFFKDYFQIPSGRYAVIKLDDAKIEKYWEFSYAIEQITDEKIAVDLIRSGYEHTFKLCKEIIGDRKVVIPLSGGYDSRLVLNGLLKSGVDKDSIITFTSGIKEYEDSNISKKVANAVGIKNYYINYNTSRARTFFKNNFKKYALHSSSISSTPHLQEWYAISELVRQDIIDEQCVFMPGYGGVLPGHYIKEKFLIAEKKDLKDIIKIALRTFASCKARPTEQDVTETVEEILKTSYFEKLNESSSCKDYIECYERFIYMEEQSKYIQNSTRNYDYVGCQYITPFFLKEQFELWSKIDNSLRLNNKAFMECMNGYLLKELADIPFTGSKVEKKARPKQSQIKKLLTFLFDRTKAHYMFGMFPIITYYRCFFKNFYIKLDYLSGWEMLRVLKNQR